MAGPVQMHIDILVEGVEDCVIVGDVETAIRAAFRDRSWPGAWRVTVGPSTVRGRWELHLRGPARHHVMSIDGPMARLAQLVAERLRDSLDRANAFDVAPAGEPRAVLGAT